MTRSPTSRPASAAGGPTDRSMWALRAHRRGGPDELVHEQAPRPPLSIGDVLVAVHAASFTPTELDWPSTWTDRLGRDRTPVVPAHEVSGVVAALGYGTSGLSVGDEVFGLTDWYRDGAAAGYVAVEARNLAPKPTSVDHLRAAAVPLARLTAWQALFDHGHLQAAGGRRRRGRPGPGPGRRRARRPLLAPGRPGRRPGHGGRRHPRRNPPPRRPLGLLRRRGRPPPADRAGPPGRHRLAAPGRRPDLDLAEGRQAFQAKQRGRLPGKAVLQVTGP